MFVRATFALAVIAVLLPQEPDLGLDRLGVSTDLETKSALRRVGL